MQNSVYDRRKDKTRRDEEDEPGIEGVHAGKNLTTTGLRGVYGSHSAQEHRGVEKSIKPRKPFKIGVPHHPPTKRKAHKRKREEKMLRKAPVEDGARHEGLVKRVIHLKDGTSLYHAYQSTAMKWQALPMITKRCQTK